MEGDSRDGQDWEVQEIREGQLWRRRGSSESFDVWTVAAEFVVVYSNRAENRRPLEIPYGDFQRDFELVDERPWRRGPRDRPEHETPEQRRAYEEACVAAVRQEVEGVNGALWNRRQVTGIELRGVYPDTEIVISFTDDGRSSSEVYDIWRDDPPGDLTDARDADMTAGIIFVNVSGM
jgi:hypothetical protein